MNKLVRTRVLRRLEKNPLGYKSIKQDKLRLFGRLECAMYLGTILGPLLLQK